MKLSESIKNNRGFSLVELIVIIAIIAIAGGASIMSVSLVVGSEAKKAFQKLETQLDETKTGSMSRYDETLEIKYLTQNVDDGVDTDGYYAVKEVSTLKPAATTSGTSLKTVKPIDSRSMGEEKRRLCDDRVTFTVVYNDGSADQTATLSTDASSSLKINYDRATGLLKDVTITAADGSAVSGKLVKISCASGLRTYTMSFNDAGKHIRE